MKFEIKNLKEGGICLFEKSDEKLIWLGEIRLRKEKNKHYSHCYQDRKRFDYHGIEKALCRKVVYKEKNQLKGDYFKPKRILVIQMK